MGNLKLNKNSIKYIVCSVLGIAIIIYFIYQVILMNSSPYRTETAIERKLQNTIETKGFVVRDEAYLTASDPNGTIVSIAEDGKRVGSGETVAISFKTAQSAATYVKINELNREIDYYNQLKNKVGAGTNSPSSYNSMINSASIKYICSAMTEIDSDFEDALGDLRDAITTKQLAVGTVISVDEKLAALQAQLLELNGQNLGYTSIASPNPGYYIGSVDGYENAVKYSDVMKKNVEDINGLLSSSPSATQSNIMGKLVDSFNWYILCNVPYELSGSLEVGKTVKVNIPNTSAGTFECSVEKKGDKEGDYISIVLKCGLMNRDVAKLRITDIEIITDEFMGFRISNEAIREVDSQKGVYVLRGNTVQFKKVNILFSSEEYSIIESKADSSSYIRQYDTVITQGVDLYDGKVIS